MAKARSYLYVIAPQAQAQGKPECKVGRSNNPPLRRSQLQVGKAERLKLYGQWPVEEGTASALEVRAHAALASAHVLGEVVRVEPAVACDFVKRIASGEDVDAFCCLALDWSLSSQRGDWTHAAEAMRLMLDRDPDRAGAIDPIAAGIRQQRTGSPQPQKRILRPRRVRSEA